MGDTYEVRVVGALGAAGREAFADLAVDVEPTATVLSGELDQAALHDVLDRVRALGLELVDVKLAPGRPGGHASGSSPGDKQRPGDKQTPGDKQRPGDKQTPGEK